MKATVAAGGENHRENQCCAYIPTFSHKITTRIVEKQVKLQQMTREDYNQQKRRFYVVLHCVIEDIYGSYRSHYVSNEDSSCYVGYLWRVSILDARDLIGLVESRNIQQSGKVKWPTKTESSFTNPT